MKKITLFFVFLALMSIKIHGQCIKTYQVSTVTSNNIGLPQVLQTCAYTTNNFIVLNSLIIGEEYTFTCKLGSTDKYITVTDLNNEVIGYGPSPLVISDISVASVRLHLSENEYCDGGLYSCHTVTAQLSLSCPLPTEVSVSEVSSTSADFAWMPGGSETAWEIIILPSTTAAPAIDATAGITVINDNPVFSATALSPATSYKFYYRAVCSSTDKSPWNSSAAFITLCEPVTYFTESFDASINMPVCWAKVGTQGYINAQGTSSAASLPNNMYLSSGFSAADKGVLGMPAVSNFNTATNRIRFKMKSSYGIGASVEFGYLGDATDPNSFVSLQTFTSNSDSVYNEYSYEPGTAPETGNFAFRHPGSSAASVVIDDVTWEPIPNCSDVTTLAVTSSTSNAAVVSWISSESGFEVVYGTAIDTNPNTLTPLSVAQNIATLSSLESNTTYKVWVRSSCGNGNYGAWIGPKSFATTCSPVTSFSENFDASTTLPACWIKVGTGGNVYGQYSGSTTSLPNNISISSYDNSYGILCLPPVSNAGSGTNRLKFTARASSSIGGILQVGYLANLNDAASFVALQSFTTNSTTTYQTFIFQPQAGVIPGELLAIRHSGVPTYAVQIDDVVWETAPNCADVSSLSVSNITNNSVKVSWTGTTETNWQVAYGATTVTDPNTATVVAVAVNSNTTLSALAAATTYKFWVRSNCGNGEFGAWIGPLSFTTSCDPVTEFSENFDASSNSLPGCWSKVGTGGTLFVQSNSPVSAPNNLYLSSFGNSYGIIGLPPVSNAAAGTNKLKFKARSAYTVGGTIEVGYLASYNEGSSFVSLESFPTTSTTQYDEFSVSLGTLPQTGYLALRHSGTPYDAVYVDDISWEILPNCEDASALTNNLITDTTATVSWSVQTSSSWQLAYADISVTDPSGLTPADATETQFTFTDLQPDTSYKYWVRSYCGDGEYSEWVGPKTFKTNCTVIAQLPWTEGFDDAAVPDFPNCWSKQNGDWVTSNATNRNSAYSGNNYLRDSWEATNEYMWTPAFALVAGTAYDFSAQVQGDGFNSWTVDMLYNNSAISEGATQLGETYQVPGAGNVSVMQQYHEMRRTFTPTVSGTYYFAVKVNENSGLSPWYVAFDDFTLELSTGLGTPGFETAALKAYPNPVKDILNISSAQNISNVEVFNLLGQQLIAKSINASDSSIDMTSLPSGSYLVKITADNQSKTIKVIKQ